MTPGDRLLVVTDRRLCADAGRSLPDAVASCARAGARSFLFREKVLPRPERRALALACLEALGDSGAVLRIASDPELAAALGGLPVHAAASDPVPATPGWGRSCHDRAEVARAAAQRASYLTLSPVFASASKPAYGPTLGITGLRRLIPAARGVPVYALGGVDASRAGACLEAGAAGVAVMSALMAAPDPEQATRDLLEAIASAAASAV